MNKKIPPLGFRSGFLGLLAIPMLVGLGVLIAQLEGGFILFFLAMLLFAIIGFICCGFFENQDFGRGIMFASLLLAIIMFSTKGACGLGF